MINNLAGLIAGYFFARCSTLARNIPVLADEALRQQILDVISDGGGLKGACEKIGLSRSNVYRYRMKDEDFDAAYREAMLSSAEIELEDALVILKTAKTRDQILQGDKLLRHAEWLAEKILPRYQPKQKVEVEHSGPMVIGWDTGPRSCPNCGWNMEVVNENVIKHEGGDAEGLQERVSGISPEAGAEEASGGT